MSFRVTFFALIIFVVVVISQLVDSAVSVDHEMGDTVESATGESITLICDLRDTPGVSQIWFSDAHYYLSLGESIDASVSPGKASRLTVVCYEPEESCELTIVDLRRNDAGTYMCGVVTPIGHRRSLASVEISVLVPPSDTSPICRLFSDGNQPITSEMATVGNPVLLSCIVTGGTPRPTVYIARDGVELTHRAAGSFSHRYTLTEEDIGIYFSCVIEHPALAKPRACLLLSLSGPSTEEGLPTSTIRPTIDAVDFTVSSDTPAGKRNQTSAIPVNMSSTLFAVIITAVSVSVILLIIAGLCILACLIHRTRNKKHPALTQPDYELSFALDPSLTTDYAVLNYPDSVDNPDKPQPGLRSSKPSLRLPNKSRATMNHPDVIPVYAKPDKYHYEHRKYGSNATARQDGLTYADLDLGTDPMDATTLSIPINKEATVYADILGTIKL